MWVKITSKEQLSKIPVPGLIIKYPIDGTVARSFDEADTENAAPRFVTRNASELAEIDLRFYPEQFGAEVILGSPTTIHGPVHKTYESLIEDDIWWINE